mgnify:CR=1 FL=1
MFFKRLYYTSSSSRFLRYLRNGGGVKIGNDCIIRCPKTAFIDMTRPCLITIGNHVDMNRYFQILTHDWASSVFRNKYHEFINSSGKVAIGNNIYFGTNVTVLKGVTIGDNCIIGAHSLVTHDIPSNSVAAGVPCRVICSLDDYFYKRKRCALDEAKEYIKSFRERFGRNPNASELGEEFIYFVNKENISDYAEIPIKFQLGAGYDDWLKSHKSPFGSLDEFLNSIDD